MADVAIFAGELSTNALKFVQEVPASRSGDLTKCPQSSAASVSRGEIGPEGGGLGAAGSEHERLLRCALLAVAHGKLHSLGGHPLEAGQIRPLASLVTRHPHDLEIAKSFACVAAAMGDGGGAREALLDEALGALVQIYSLPLEGDDVVKVLDASSEAARCLCGIINDPLLSLRKEVVALYSLRAPRKEVQRCVILRLSALSRNPDMVMRIVSGPALKVLATAVVPPSQRLLSTPQSGKAGFPANIGSPYWGGSRDSKMEDADAAALRCDALLGLASLCAVREMRVELLRLQILGPVISALACGENFFDEAGVQTNVPKQNGHKGLEDVKGQGTGKVAEDAGDDSKDVSAEAGILAPVSLSHDEAHQNALAIVKELSQMSVRLSRLSFVLQPRARLETAAPPPIRLESLPEGAAGGASEELRASAEAQVEEVCAVVVAGWWYGSICGPMVVVGPASLERSNAGGGIGGSNCGGWGPGDVVVLSAPQASREAAVAAMRTCQAGGAAAVILNVGAVPAPFPLLEHLPRDYGDLMIPILVLPKDDIARLQLQIEILCASSRATASSNAAATLPTSHGKSHADASPPPADAPASSSATASVGAVAKETGGGSCGGCAQGVVAVTGIKGSSGSSGSLKGLLLAASGATAAVVSASTAATNVAATASSTGATSVTARAADESTESNGAVGVVTAASHNAAASLGAKRETHSAVSNTSTEASDVHSSPAAAAASGAEAAAAAAPRPHAQLMCTIDPPLDCRREMITRAVPLLRRMYETANDVGPQHEAQTAIRRPSAARAVEGGGGADEGKDGNRLGEDVLERRQAAWRQKIHRHQVVSCRVACPKSPRCSTWTSAICWRVGVWGMKGEYLLRKVPGSVCS